MRHRVRWAHHRVIEDAGSDSAGPTTWGLSLITRTAWWSRQARPPGPLLPVVSTGSTTRHPAWSRRARPTAWSRRARRGRPPGLSRGLDKLDHPGPPRPPWSRQARPPEDRDPPGAVPG